jgi:parvulin-like peptidyl-prolyl isomerase
MLEQMRKHMNWIMWIILILVIVSFLFFGIYPSSGGRGAAATVNGEVVTVVELNRAYRNMYETYRQIFKDQINDSITKGLRQQALRDLIQNRLLVQEAKLIGLRVTDEEVQAAIMRTPSFTNQGRFDKAAYERYLDYINEKPSVFEETQREYMLKQKIERIIEESVEVTEDELRAAYAARNPKAKAGDLEKNRESFRQTLLIEKKRTTVDAYAQALYKKGKVTMNQAEIDSL